MKTRAQLRLILLLWTACAAGAIFWVGCTTDSVISSDTDVNKSGTKIEGDRSGVLSASSSPYWVTGDLTVPAGESLVIEPGVELRFDGVYQFTVLGHLEAIGTAEENIIFTSMDGALGGGDLGQWRAIVFDTGTQEANGDTSELAYCLIQFGASSDTTDRYPDSTGFFIFSAIFCWNSSPIIRNSTIVRNGYHGIFCIGSNSNPRILNSIITENDGDGIRCEEGATADIWYNDVYLNSTREFADTPAGIGEMTQLNVNRDSCDFQFNISLNPGFSDIEIQDYDLLSCSPCIGTGQGDEHIGSIPYYVGATELRGPIGGSILTAASSPWFVSCDVFIDPGETLTIEAGAQILFQGLYEMRISGLLEAEGATLMPEDSTSSGARWLGILITEEADPASFIRNCLLLNATTSMKEDPYGGAITVQGLDLVEISGNTIEGSEYTAISCQNGAQPQISDNIIEGFGPAAIYCYNNSHPVIYHNIIRNGSGYGIWCNFSSSPFIRSNLIYTGSHVGIKCQDQSSPLIEYNTISDHSYSGLECYGWSNPVIKNNIIAFNGDATTWQGGYGNGINVQVSSFPLLSYNDVYQPEGEGSEYSGISADSTSINLDPLFVNAAANDYHLQSGSPCLTAASDGGEIGAYGEGDW